MWFQKCLVCGFEDSCLQFASVIRSVEMSLFYSGITGKVNRRDYSQPNLDNLIFRDGAIPSLQGQERQRVPYFNKVVPCWGKAGNHGGNY